MTFNITVNRHNLLNTLSKLQGVAAGRNTLPILSNVLIRVDSESVELIATDLEVGIRASVSDALIHSSGATTVSAKKLHDIVAECGTKSIRLYATVNDRVEIASGTGVFKIIGLPDEEFPVLPQVNPDQQITITGHALRSVLYRATYAASTEEIRYFLNGLYFNCLPDRLEVVATDGRQLALAQSSPLELKNEGFIIPLKACIEMARVFDESERINIARFENQLILSDGVYTITTRLTEGEYPQYEKIIPESGVSKKSLVVNRVNLLHAIRRVAVLSPKTYAVMLEIDAQSCEIHLVTETEKVGNAHETVKVTQPTESFRIMFDSRLLLDALYHLSGELVRINHSGGLNPFVITSTTEAGHLALIMPMRMDT